ncbi:hypothetical protein [Clostridium sp. BJN0013]|jgi:hypothetical protein|uniref:hypothetical protein n=1 Tax=Clostridium sp. BJN0013 TaxID=3236840 RepID=UPI0034C682A3
MHRVCFCGCCSDKGDEYMCEGTCSNYTLKSYGYKLKKGECEKPYFKTTNKNDLKDSILNSTKVK